MSDSAYAWRSARSRAYRSQGNEGVQAAQVEAMAEQGRRPVFNMRGQVRGYSSRAGSPNVSPSLGIAGAPGTQEHANAWDAFFRQPTAPTPIVAPAAAPSSAPAPVVPPTGSDSASAFESFYGGGNPARPPSAPTTPQDSLAATIAGHSAWMGSRGIQVPPPPVGADTGMPAAPFMPRGPAAPFGVPTPLTSPDGNAGTDAAALAANKSMYAPGGSNFFKPTYPTGWQGPTAPVQAGNYTSQYGAASVQTGQQYQTAKRVSDWGTPLPPI